MRALAAAVVLALAPGLAGAEGFFTRDLGAGGTGEQCMVRGLEAMRTYARRHGMPSSAVDQGSWSVQGWDLPPGNVDVQLLCPYRNNMSDIVLLVAHSDGDEHERQTVVEAINEIWNALGSGGTPGTTK